MSIPPTAYIVSLVAGLVAIGITYLDSLQTKQKVSRTTYIKIFIGAALISLGTAAYITQGRGSRSTPVLRGGGGSSLMGAIPRQSILTGTPDF